MEIIPICPDAWGANCYLLTSGTESFVVDPGVSADAICRAAEDAGCRISAILLTHGHFDHILSIDTLRAKCGAPVWIHEGDAPMLTDGDKNAFAFFYGKERAWHAADRLLHDGEILPLAGESVTVHSTPGHSPGSVCFETPAGLLTGDTLFSDNVGRCDLWGGDEATLRTSLEYLRRFDPNTRIFPGHGPSERLANALDNTVYF